MPSSTTWIDNFDVAFWVPAAIGILIIWKLELPQEHFYIFARSEVPYHHDAIANVHVEKVVTDTIYSLAAPCRQIVIETVTEVEVSAYTASPESIAHYQEKMDEVDVLIDAITAVEEEYWGDIFV